LFPHMTVAANVATVPRLLEWPEARIRARVDELLAMIGLAPETYRERWPDELSGGERQRVGLARALAADPPLLLMDEPFGALDPITKSELHAEFRRVQAALRRTVVLVTHDMAEAFALADRIAVLCDGQICACDTPPAVRASTDPRVAALVASR
jgi:osmoprotectant transport system ATP-binding protein